ncbi:MAG: amidohydrolase family protein [Ignavibacteriaceae bacterium]|nr:amidohydrolase family protein [Ignavibacteriaceae bacterium]
MPFLKFLTVLLLFISFPVFSQKPVPALQQSEAILIKGGIAHTGEGTIINNSLIGFTDGIITLIDSTNGNADLSKYSKVIDATGKHIYPGFIATNTIIGLVEIPAVRATRDHSETGNLNPNVRSLIAFNTDSKIIPTTRTNGVLITQATPFGGWISGTSSLMDLDGWNWQDAVNTPDIGIHLFWQNEFSFGGRRGDRDPKLQLQEGYSKFISEIRTLFSDAKAYSQLSEPVYNGRLESMRDLFSGEKILFIHVNYAKDIITSVEFALKADVQKVVIVGGAESYKVLDFLKEKSIPVLVRDIFSLPLTQSDEIDIQFKLPKILSDNGILFGFDMSNESTQARNLPFAAGYTTAYGLTFEEALSAITFNIAKILGVDDKIGSLKVGKEATLFVSSGNALEITGNNVEHAFIKGKTLDLRNEQIELYERYKNKYGIK